MTIQYDPQKVTDWLTPLEKVYARQSQQLDRYHQQLRERDRQEEAAVVNVPEMFAKLASFSSSIKQVVDARETGQKTKASGEEQKLRRKLSAEDLKKRNEIQSKYELDKKGLFKDSEGFEKAVKDSGLLDKYTKEELFGSSPKMQLMRREVSITRQADSIDIKFKEALKDPKWNRKWSETEGNPIQRAALREDIIDEITATWDTSEGLYYSGVEKKLNDYLKTKVSTDKLKLSEIQATKKEDELYGFINDSVNPETRGVAISTTVKNNTIYADPETPLSERRQAWDSFFLSTDRGIRSGEIKLTQDQLLDTPVKRDDGAIVPLSEFATKEDLKTINEAYNTYNTAIFEQSKATEELRQQSILVDIEQKPQNWTEAKLQEEVFKQENSVYANPKLLKELKEVDLAAYDSDIAAQELEDWTVLDDNGTLLTKDNIAAAKLIKNKTINRQITKRQDDLRLSYRKNKMDNYEKRNIQHGRNIIKKSGKGTLGDQEYDLDGWPGMLQNELTSLEASIYKDLYDRNPSDTTIKGQVIEEIEKIKTRNGWYAKAGDPDEGIWTFDENGDLTNLKNSIKSKNLRLANWDLVEAREHTNKNKMIAWDNNILNAAKNPSPNGKTFTEKLINTPLLEEDDIIAPIQFGWERIGDGNQFKITSKTGYIASRIPNVTRVELWKAQATLLINSDNPKHKELVKTYQLEEAVKGVQDPQRTLIDFAENTGDKFLKNVIQTNPEQVSPKQWDRLIKKSEDTSTPTPSAEDRLNFKEANPSFISFENSDLDKLLQLSKEELEEFKKKLSLINKE